MAYEVPYGTIAEIVEQAAAAAPDALVLRPDEVRDATIARLRAVAGRALSTEVA